MKELQLEKEEANVAMQTNVFQYGSKGTFSNPSAKVCIQYN